MLFPPLPLQVAKAHGPSHMHRAIAPERPVDGTNSSNAQHEALVVSRIGLLMLKISWLLTGIQGIPLPIAGQSAVKSPNWMMSYQKKKVQVKHAQKLLSSSRVVTFS